MPTIYAGGKATKIADTADFYRYMANNSGLGAQEFSNNPFGVSYQQIQTFLNTPKFMESYRNDPAGDGGGGGPTGGSTAPTGGSGGSGTPAPVLNQSAVDATQQAINSLGTEQNVGYRNIDDSYSSLIGGYDKEKQRNEADYTEQGVTNNTNLSKNRQNALLAASQGMRGLRGTLAAIGALGGTGRDLANRAVTTEANQDIGGALDTATTNAKVLDKSWGRFQEEDEDRRREADTAKANQRTALEGSIASKRQQFLQKLAEIFGAADRTGEAGNYLRQAGGLNEEIASKTRVGSTPFAARAAAFSPGTLENYLAGAGDMTVDVAPAAGGLINPTTILAGGRRPRRREEEEELMLAAA